MFLTIVFAFLSLACLVLLSVCFALRRRLDYINADLSLRMAEYQTLERQHKFVIQSNESYRVQNEELTTQLRRATSENEVCDEALHNYRLRVAREARRLQDMARDLSNTFDAWADDVANGA